MKALVCELCGSNDIMKQDGCFVCQHCGTKYSVEEARKMMVEGTVEVQGTVKIDNTTSVQSFLDIGETALLGGNGEQAKNYADKALEVDSRNPLAWSLKMRSYRHAATLGNLQIEEMLAAGAKVIEYSNSEEDVEKTYEYYLSIAIELLELAKSKFKETPSSNIWESYKGFSDLYNKIISSAVMITDNVPTAALSKYFELPLKLMICADAYDSADLARYHRIKNYLLIDSSYLGKEVSKIMRERACKGLLACDPDCLSKLNGRLRVIYRKNDRNGVLSEYEQLKKRSSELLKESERLGMFKVKEKMALDNELKTIQKRIHSLEPEAERIQSTIPPDVESLKKAIAYIESDMN